MNIFYLDECPEKAAEFHCDKHVVKMILESAQMLSTVWRIYYPEVLNFEDKIYKATHKNHPCTVWASKGKKNYEYLVQLTEELTKEYTFRYDKIHKTSEVLKFLKDAPVNMPDIWTEPAQAMPEEYKNPDPVVAYRNYYKNAKKDLLLYKNRAIPEWLKENNV